LEGSDGQTVRDEAERSINEVEIESASIPTRCTKGQDDSFARYLSRFAKRGEWLIPRKNETDIINAVHRANAWLRRYLPERTKALHELRKEFGSQIYAATGSLSAAAEALGDTLETARAHYLTQLQPTKALSLASLLS